MEFFSTKKLRKVDEKHIFKTIINNLCEKLI